MDSRIKTLDIASFPLEGLALIEASAGTGKTFTVSNLVLRYVLEKHYTIEQILVVTFTEAATQELRVRIRDKLAEAITLIEYVLEHVDLANGARGERIKEVNLDPIGADGLLTELLRGSDDLVQDLLRLRLAEQSVDLAEIHTIHGFCQKVAREHAVLMNLPGEQTLKENFKAEWLQACQDLWRAEVLRVPEPALDFIRSKWGNPQKLSSAIGVFSSRQAQRVTPLAALHKRAENETPVQWWARCFDAKVQWHESLVDMLEQHLPDVQRVVAVSALRNVDVKLKWLIAIQDWLEEGAPWGLVEKLNLDRFFDSRIRADVRKGCQAPKHLFFVVLEQHFENQPKALDAMFLQAFYVQAKERLEQKKRAELLMGFDDLILQVHDAVLDPKLEHALTQQLRKHYRVALIDEFQDTDSLQYPIFSRVFGVAAQQSSPSHDASLVLIGDPKQAIYGFRGGDMATYLKARSDVLDADNGHVFTMRDNWRSTTAVLDAFNTLYANHDKPFLEKDIPYVEVRSGMGFEKPEWGAGLYIDQVSNELDDGKSLNKEATSDILASFCAARVVGLLKDDALDVKSSDITVLVRDRKEAALMQAHLNASGVKCSYDNRDSIFHSAEALSVYKLLFAALNPADERALIQCLSDPVWGLRDSSLKELQQDEYVAGEWLDRFRGFGKCWQDHGVVSMIRRAMVELGVLEHWNGSADEALLWERRLSNIGQVAELLQAQSMKLAGLTSLLHWLARSLVEDGAEPGKEKEIRLESDDELVRIVTIHSSKGLEYPIVFIPFLFSGKESRPPLWYYDDSGRLTLALAPDEKEKSFAAREALAEDCRLLYVALTRTKYRCYIGTSEFKGKSLDTSATGFGYLLRNNQLADKPEKGWLQARLEELGAHNSIDYTYWSNEELDAFFAQNISVLENKPGLESVRPKRLAPDVKSDWRVQSFTGLMNEHHRLHPQIYSVVKQPAVDARYANETNQIHILNFPKGSNAGTFLHTLFEHTDFESGGLIEKYARSGESLQEHISKLLVRKQLVSEFKQQAWAEYLAEWVRRILALELSTGHGPGLRLRDLSKKDRVVEAEFFFRVSALAAKELNITLSAFREDLPALGFEQFRGHIKGAIDLTFRHDGRYYLLDYKSNHLGFEAEDYSHARLEAAIVDHRYDVQYLLYSVALHRLLKQRVGESYDYDTHFGGVYYLFLRGMELDGGAEGMVGDNASRDKSALPGVYFARPEKALIERLDALMGAQVGSVEEGVSHE